MDYFDALRCNNKKATLSLSRDGNIILRTPKEEFTIGKPSESSDVGEPIEELGDEQLMITADDLQDPIHGTSKTIVTKSDEFPGRIYYVVVFKSHPRLNVPSHLYCLHAGHTDV